MNILGAALTSSLLLVAVAGCSDEPGPRTTSRATLQASPYETRVFEAVQQTGDLTKTVTLPRGSRSVAIVLDCAGTTGELTVALTGVGAATSQCTPTVTGRGPLVVLSGDGTVLERRQTITVTAPGDQAWSAAVDAGAQAPASSS